MKNEQENQITEMSPIESLADAFFIAQSVPEAEENKTDLFDLDIDAALA